MELAKKYNIAESEKKWQDFWEKEKIFKFNEKSKKEFFSIDTPPPTVSGKMHMGHAYSYIQMDIMARFWRMQDYELFYPFGTDDNGLPTERLVEKMKGVRIKEMERADFIDLCMQTVEELRPKYIQAWKQIGLSCDFEMFYSTIDDHSRKISQWSFLDLYKKKRIYKKRAPFMWCPECQTAISQIELKGKEQQSNLIYFKLDTDLDKPITVATTRPELLPACVAVHVHPKDKRYKDIVGHKAKLPFFDREVEIYANENVDMEYGTGAVYHCTFGDMDDVEWIEEFKIKPIEIVTKDGHLNEDAGQFAGLSIKKARKVITEALKKDGRVEKIETIQHVVNTHERCDTDIEILMTDQWFVKVLDMRDKLLEAGNKINWHPEFMKNRYDNWVKGLKYDWNISRQRFFGVPIPAWICEDCGEIILAQENSLPIDPFKDKPPVDKCPKCSSLKITPEKDVIDTWATSSLTPQLAIELVENKKVKKKLYPMKLRPQAHDIVTFWLFNTVVKSLLHYNKLPWENAMISGWVLDPEGIKMSKSKGNIVDPTAVLAEYGTDAVRYWASGNSLGRDIRFTEKELNNGKRLITKLWNVTKFTLPHLENYKLAENKNLREVDKWLLNQLQNVSNQAEQYYKDYDYAKAMELIYNFFWHDFADNYIEFVKYRLYNQEEVGEESYQAAQYTLYVVLRDILKLFAPVIPYVTEEIWSLCFNNKENSNSIHITDWPKENKKLQDKEIEKTGEKIIEILTAVREHKTKNNLSMNAEIKEFEFKLDTKNKEAIESWLEDLQKVSGVKEFLLDK